MKKLEWTPEGKIKIDWNAVFAKQEPQPDPPPRNAICSTCEEADEVPSWEFSYKDDPFICNWCLNKGRRNIGIRLLPFDASASLETLHEIDRARAAFAIFDRWITKARHQIKTGKQGEALRWDKMTWGQRAAYREKPSPRTA